MIKIKTLYFIALCVSLVGCGMAVTPVVQDWKVDEILIFHNLKRADLEMMSETELLSNKYTAVKDPRLKNIFSEAYFKSGVPIMKGQTMALVRFAGGGNERIWISSYGSFFGVIGQSKKGIFRFDGNASTIWNELIFGTGLERVNEE